SVSKQLENFAGAMNFVIFPMFFASSALYPLWRVREASPLLYYVCELNPFTHAVELVRFALYCQINWISLSVFGGCTALFRVGASLASDPARGFLARRGEPGGGGAWDVGPSPWPSPLNWPCEACRSPPIRASPIGRAARSRCRKSPLPPCGQDRPST